MTRRFYQRCLLWLLPLLVVHSLVPVGFMAAVDDRGLELAFCPVQSARVVEVLKKVHAADHSHHHGAHSAQAASPDADHSEHARSSSCPFALADSPLLATATPVFSVTFLHVNLPLPPEDATPFGVVHFERNRIRGPPQLA
jgi:hypothetical protein